MAISLRIAEAEAHYLAELSARLGVSQSEVLRRGLNLLAEQHLGVGKSAYALGADLFAGEATVDDPELSHSASARLRALLRDEAP